jgi:hypothetical protein
MRHTRDVDDGDEMVPDGGSVTVAMQLMDSHRPQLTTDAAAEMRKAARDGWLRTLVDAWKRPAGRAEPEPDDRDDPGETMRRHLRPDEKPDDAQARRNAAWAAYRDQLSNAWRTDPRTATAIEREGERWRHGR